MSNPNKKSVFLPCALMVVAVVLMAASGMCTYLAQLQSASSPVALTSESHVDSHSYKPSDSSGCFQKVYFLEVEAGQTVWSVVSAQVQVNYPAMTALQHENEVSRVVTFMQGQVDLNPWQAVKSLDNVPVKFSFAMSSGDDIYLPGEGQGWTS